MILLCFGTRPEWLKIKPLIKKLTNYKLLFTGQHIDLLNNLKVDYRIQINNNSNRLDQIIADCLLQFPNEGYDSVLVQGDTASAFACALAAFNRNKKIYYLEAGLRSYNLEHPYPEEAYRQMISRLSDMNFCPTSLSKQNLNNEKVNGECYVVGNTILDNLVEYKNICKYKDKVLITLHRRENHFWINEWFIKIDNLAKKYSHLEFVLPIHPNPNVIKHRDLLKNVKVVEPLPYDQLIELLIDCKLIITDSGGLQEEGSFLNKKVIVCRKTTERPEGINTDHLHLCPSPDNLENIFDNLIDRYSINSECPYGDGYSSERVAKIINENI
jgi:UDP-N-acetylglucosamine 2-epimerase (non-hydrolysing)